MSTLAVLPDLDPKAYPRHSLHAEDRVWVEKNCYVDIWLEVIHALGLEPRAMLPFVVGLDFEGDQWAFFKPVHDELRELYGLDVQELNVWRPLLDHAVEYVGQGKLISTEADAFWLPDTSGTDYQQKHTKTTIVINAIDVERGWMGYFHNAGYHALEGEDFARTFRVGAPADPTFMPLFAEAVRIDRKVVRPEKELAAMSRALLKKHFERRPIDNPVTRFQARFERDLPWLTREGLDFYHAWAFATVRQVGAAFELAADLLRWLEKQGQGAFEGPAASFDAISNGAKTFILKAARAVNAKRAVDAAPLFEGMRTGWSEGMEGLSRAL